MEHNNYSCRIFLPKSNLYHLKSIIRFSILNLIWITLFIHNEISAQSIIPDLEQHLIASQSFGVEEKALDWPLALDELKTIIHSDKEKNALSKEVAKLLVEAYEYNTDVTQVLSDFEKKETNQNLEKLYFESIDKVRTSSTTRNDAEQLAKEVQDHFNIFLQKFPIKRIHRAIALISEIQSADSQLSSPHAEAAPLNESQIEKDPHIKPLRRELKALLQQTLDEKGSESEEFKLYQKLLNSHEKTKIILDRNNKVALLDKLEKAKKTFDQHKQLIKSHREQLAEEIKILSYSNSFANIDERDPFFEGLEQFEDIGNYIRNYDNYFIYKNKINSLQSRLNSGSDYSFKNALPFHQDFQLSQEECSLIGFNNLSNMGPDTNQRDTSTCWAHATAALIEEQLCLSNPELCGKRVSRTYIIGKTKGIDFSTYENLEGANTLNVLYYLTDPNGGNFEACLDSYSWNPLNIQEFDYLRYLREEYNLLKYGFISCSFQLSKFFENLLVNWKKLLMFLDDHGLSDSHPNHSLSRPKFEQLALESRGPDEFVQKVLLFPCNHLKQQVNFKRNPEQHLVTMDFSKDSSIQNFVNVFKDAKSYHHSVLTTICFNPFLKELHPSKKLRTKECGSHAVVINAIQWNPTENHCEVHLKNSHSQNSPAPSGWYPAEMVFTHTKTATYFGFD